MSADQPENANASEGRRAVSFSRLRLLAIVAAAALAAVVTIEAGAAPSTVPPVSQILGLGGEHGEAVREGVEGAKDSLSEDEKLGPAVSEAACTAAHDRSTLPDGAQNAPGQAGREVKDCSHPSNALDAGGEEPGQPPVAEGADGSDAAEQAAVDTHGASVSQAVHEAKAAAQEAGTKVGHAVREAACTAALDRGTLPEGAQNAPGQEGREARDCAHPSQAPTDTDANEADAGDDASEMRGGGKASAPGQVKKPAN